MSDIGERRAKLQQEIAAWMPGSYCLDSEEDCMQLARAFHREFGGTISVKRIANDLHGLSWCTDNDEERMKIAKLLSMHSLAWTEIR